MSDGFKILLAIMFFLLLLLGFVNISEECEAKGGRLMKTLYNTYECVYEKGANK